MFRTGTVLPGDARGQARKQPRAPRRAHHAPAMAEGLFAAAPQGARYEPSLAAATVRWPTLAGTNSASTRRQPPSIVWAGRAKARTVITVTSVNEARTNQYMEDPLSIRRYRAALHV